MFFRINLVGIVRNKRGNWIFHIRLTRVMLKVSRGKASQVLKETSKRSIYEQNNQSLCPVLCSKLIDLITAFERRYYKHFLFPMVRCVFD